MKLQPKGENGFIEFQHTPSVRASAESHVVLSAYHMALETVLASVTSENTTSTVIESQMENFIALKKLAEQIRDDVDRGDLVLEVIGAKLMTVSDGV